MEGMSNESIAVSGIYYYDQENISESRLAFRTAVEAPENYGQDDHKGCLVTWGIDRSVDSLRYLYIEGKTYVHNTIATTPVSKSWVQS